MRLHGEVERAVDHREACLRVLDRDRGQQVAPQRDEVDGRRRGDGRRDGYGRDARGGPRTPAPARRWGAGRSERDLGIADDLIGHAWESTAGTRVPFRRVRSP